MTNSLLLHSTLCPNDLTNFHTGGVYASKPSPSTLTALLSGCTAGTVDERPARQEKSEMSDGESDSDFADVANNFGRELFVGPMQFRPIYLLGTWKDPDDHNSERVSVAILLPSGVTKDDVTLNVVDNGHYLEIGVIWPSFLSDHRALHKKWLVGHKVRTLASYHPMLTCFTDFLAAHRRPDGSLSSTASIRLPFQCESRPERESCAWEGTSACVLYVILKAPAPTLAVPSTIPTFDAI